MGSRGALPSRQGAATVSTSVARGRCTPTPYLARVRNCAFHFPSRLEQRERRGVAERHRHQHPEPVHHPPAERASLPLGREHLREEGHRREQEARGVQKAAAAPASPAATRCCRSCRARHSSAKKEHREMGNTACWYTWPGKSAASRSTGSARRRCPQERHPEEPQQGHREEGGGRRAGQRRGHAGAQRHSEQRDPWASSPSCSTSSTARRSPRHRAPARSHAARCPGSARSPSAPGARGASTPTAAAARTSSIRATRKAPSGGSTAHASRVRRARERADMSEVRGRGGTASIGGADCRGRRSGRVNPGARHGPGKATPVRPRPDGQAGGPWLRVRRGMPPSWDVEPAPHGGARAQRRRRPWRPSSASRSGPCR